MGPTLWMLCNRWLDHNSLEGPIPDLSDLKNLQSMYVFPTPFIFQSRSKLISFNLLDIPNCETEGYFDFPNYQTNHFVNLHRGNSNFPWESPIGNPKNKCFLCWILARYFHIVITNWPKQYIEQSFSMDILYGSKAWSPLIYTNKTCCNEASVWKLAIHHLGFVLIWPFH